jgi:hypothetical protein
MENGLESGETVRFSRRNERVMRDLGALFVDSAFLLRERGASPRDDSVLSADSALFSADNILESVAHSTFSTDSEFFLKVRLFSLTERFERVMTSAAPSVLVVGPGTQALPTVWTESLSPGTIHP